MVRLRALSGPTMGVDMLFDGNVRRGDPPLEMDPFEVLGSFLQTGRTWELDLSAATPIEQIEWRKVDYMARVYRALADGRSVHFQGHVYRDGNQLHKVIVASGQNVAVTRDDAEGVWVETQSTIPLA